MFAHLSPEAGNDFFVIETSRGDHVCCCAHKSLPLSLFSLKTHHSSVNETTTEISLIAITVTGKSRLSFRRAVDEALRLHYQINFLNLQAASLRLNDPGARLAICSRCFAFKTLLWS